MKKSKILLICILSITLCIMCMESTTFSWFNRTASAQTATGKEMAWNISADENVIINTNANTNTEMVMTTYTSSDGGKTYDEDQPVTSFANTSGGLAAGEVKYYCTKITNKASYDRSISLYLYNLGSFGSNSAKFCLGVNGPTRSYKAYGPNSAVNASDSQLTQNNQMRIYFETNTKDWWTSKDSWQAKIRYSNGENDSWVNSSGQSMNQLKYENSRRYYYFDLPTSAKRIQICTQNKWEGDCCTPYMDLALYCNGLSSTQSYVFKLQDNTSDYSNFNCDTYSVTDGANIVNYYSEITVPKGTTFSAALTKNKDYSGTKISYTSSSSSYFSVNSSTGLITANDVGTATLTTTVTGSYGTNDTKTITTTVKVVAKAVDATTYTDVPIVTNLKVPAIEDGVLGEVEIKWYIKNDSTANGMTYNIGDLYLTL